MTIFGLTVGRNEEDRYLAPMLMHMAGVVDKHFFFDDDSTDGTATVAADWCAGVAVRSGHNVPSFVENEGAFRDGAWKVFEDYMHPQLGDWVLVIDCDEVLVVTYEHNTHLDLDHATRATLRLETAVAPTAIDLNIPEIWGFDQVGRPLQRVDKLWNTIHAPRLFRYQPEASYFHGDFGVPAVPQYVQAGQWGNTDALALMHYGYADKRDQQAKYARYIGKLGHSNNHVDSIMDTEQHLVPWEGPYVKEMSWARR